MASQTVNVTCGFCQLRKEKPPTVFTSLGPGNFSLSSVVAADNDYSDCFAAVPTKPPF